MSRHRGRRHPGVVLMKPDPERRIWWRARYADPDSGKTVKESLDLALRTTELREDWAVRKSKALALRRLELEGGAPRATGTSLATAIGRYFEDHERLRAATLDAYRTATTKLLAWAGRNGVRSGDELTGPKLLAFRAELVREKRKTRRQGGKRGSMKETTEARSPHTVNRELRAVGTVLGYLRRLGLLARLTLDGLRDGLSKLPASVERPDYRKPHELRKLLEAAVRHDADTFALTRAEHDGKGQPGSTPRYTPIAPLLATAMLTGMRAGELLGLTWDRVDLEALDNDGRVVGEIHVSAASKTKRARTVGLEVSPALRKLLAAMHVRAGRPRVGSVFGLSKYEAKAAELRLVREYGAPPRCNMQALRRTCGTYLTNAPGIFGAASAYRSAKQLGHSVAVAEKHYVDVARGIAREARTLEVAMQIEEQAAAVTSAISTQRDAARRAS